MNKCILILMIFCRHSFSFAATTSTPVDPVEPHTAPVVSAPRPPESLADIFAKMEKERKTPAFQAAVAAERSVREVVAQ